MVVVKTVGSAIITGIMLFCTSVLCAQELTLQMTSNSGEPLAQAAAGVPFVIQLVDTAGSMAMDKVPIQGLDAFCELGTSISMHSVNKKTMITYKYVVRMDKEGSYVVGPAYLNHNVSNELIVVVGKDLAFEKKQKKSSTTQSTFAQFSLQKSKLFVGEKTKLILRFYYPEGEVLQLSAVNIPQELEKNGCVLSNVAETKGEETIEKNHYQFIQWSWDMYCKHVSSFTIPASSINYGVKKSNNFFMSFVDFFDQKKIYSNALSLEVEPLPDNVERVTAVGQFLFFTSALSLNTAKQGDAIVLTLTLVGNGNFDCIATPVLQGVPSEFRVYGSQASSEKSVAQGGERKSFEYVLHGLHAGEFVIPAQQFTYFDPEVQKYHTLVTDPLTVMITPDPSFVVQHQEPEKNESVDMATVLEKGGLRVLRTERTPIYKNNVDYALPWYFFWILFFLPVILIIFLILLVYLDKFFGIFKKIKQYQAYKEAQQKLRIAQMNDQESLVYDIFTLYCAAVLDCPVSTVSTQVMHDYGKQCNFTSQEETQWTVFVEVMLQKKFSQGLEEKQYESFFMHARQWLTMLFKRKKDA